MSRFIIYLVRYFGDWKVFNWVMFSQIGMIVFVPLILPESCRWLMAKGREEKLINILKKIAKLNKKQVRSNNTQSYLQIVSKVPEYFYKDVRMMCKKQIQANQAK